MLVLVGALYKLSKHAVLVLNGGLLVRMRMLVSKQMPVLTMTNRAPFSSLSFLLKILLPRTGFVVLDELRPALMETGSRTLLRTVVYLNGAVKSCDAVTTAWALAAPRLSLSSADWMSFAVAVPGPIVCIRVTPYRRPGLRVPPSERIRDRLVLVNGLLRIVPVVLVVHVAEGRRSLLRKPIRLIWSLVILLLNPRLRLSLPLVIWASENIVIGNVLVVEQASTGLLWVGPQNPSVESVRLICK